MPLISVVVVVVFFFLQGRDMLGLPSSLVIVAWWDVEVKREMSLRLLLL